MGAAPGLSETEVRSYLTENIYYQLDAGCLEGLQLFYRYTAEIGALPGGGVAVRLTKCGGGAVGNSILSMGSARFSAWFRYSADRNATGQTPGHA